MKFGRIFFVRDIFRNEKRGNRGMEVDFQFYFGFKNQELMEFGRLFVCVGRVNNIRVIRFIFRIQLKLESSCVSCFSIYGNVRIIWYLFFFCRFCFQKINFKSIGLVKKLGFKGMFVIVFYFIWFIGRKIKRWGAGGESDKLK